MPERSPPPFVLHRPAYGDAPSPLVLASPHSGRDYPAAFLAASHLDAETLRLSEDRFVDALFADAPSLGVPLLAACFPRAFCDVNRGKWELDPEMFADPLPSWCDTRTRHVAAGHGTIPKMVGAGARIHRRKLRFADARARIEACWEPYHLALSALLSETRARHGACLLIDCHSMPAERTARPADFVLGDHHGRSCDAGVASLVDALLRAAGHRVRRNEPYAGGYVTRHYGRPGDGIHVLQVEVSRGLYLSADLAPDPGGFAALRAMFRGLVETVAASGEVRGLRRH